LKTRYAEISIVAANRAQVPGDNAGEFNAANEVAVARFVQEKIKFTDIFATVERTMSAHRTVAHSPLDAILEAILGQKELNVV
jgi:1-deoxy-D-xylulose-5-phosphate reductoisomerase